MQPTSRGEFHILDAAQKTALKHHSAVILLIAEEGEMATKVEAPNAFDERVGSSHNGPSLEACLANR